MLVFCLPYISSISPSIDWTSNEFFCCFFSVVYYLLFSFVVQIFLDNKEFWQVMNHILYLKAKQLNQIKRNGVQGCQKITLEYSTATFESPIAQSYVFFYMTIFNLKHWGTEIIEKKSLKSKLFWNIKASNRILNFEIKKIKYPRYFTHSQMNTILYMRKV